MKTILKISVLALLLGFLSCKDEQKEGKSNEVPKEATEVKEEISNDNFTFSIEGLFKVDDYFQLFYAEDLTSNFNKKESIIIKVTKSDSLQTIKFALPKHVYPVKIRFDLGGQRNTSNVEIKNCVLVSERGEFEISEDMFLTYFNPNSNIEVVEGKKYRLVEKKNKNGVVYDPCFMSNKELNSVLKNLIYF